MKGLYELCTTDMAIDRLHAYPTLRRVLLVGGWIIAAVPIGCKPKVEPRPANVLPPEKMVHMLTRSYLSEAITTSRRLPFDSGRALELRALATLAKASGTDTATFSRSFVYYTAHLDEMEKIYNQVVDSLGVEESKYRK